MKILLWVGVSAVAVPVLVLLWARLILALSDRGVPFARKIFLRGRDQMFDLCQKELESYFGTIRQDNYRPPFNFRWNVKRMMVFLMKVNHPSAEVLLCIAEDHYHEGTLPEKIPLASPQWLEMERHIDAVMEAVRSEAKQKLLV